MSKSVLLTRLQTAYEKTKDPLKRARLKRQMVKLSKKLEVGKAKSGDRNRLLQETSTKRKSDPLSKFIGNLWSGGGKKPDNTAISKEAFEDVDPSYWNFSDPFRDLKHGGRIKKTKKRKSRGVGVALRGYGKVMRRG